MDNDPLKTSQSDQLDAEAERIAQIDAAYYKNYIQQGVPPELAATLVTTLRLTFWVKINWPLTPPSIEL